MMIDPNNPPTRFEVDQGTMSDSRWREAAAWLLGEGALLFPIGTTEAELAKGRVAGGEDALLQPEADDPMIILGRAEFIRLVTHSEHVPTNRANVLFMSLAKVMWCQTKGYASINLPRLKFQILPENMDQIGYWDEVRADGLDVQSFIAFTQAVEDQLAKATSQGQSESIYGSIGPLINKGTVDRWINIGKTLQRVGNINRS